MVSKVLEKMGAAVRNKTIMYKAVVHNGLLYGSESWVITEAIMKLLEAFHHQISRRLMVKTSWRVGEESWE